MQTMKYVELESAIIERLINQGFTRREAHKMIDAAIQPFLIPLTIAVDPIYEQRRNAMRWIDADYIAGKMSRDEWVKLDNEMVLAFMAMTEPHYTRCSEQAYRAISDLPHLLVKLVAGGE